MNRAAFTGSFAVVACVACGGANAESPGAASSAGPVGEASGQMAVAAIAPQAPAAVLGKDGGAKVGGADVPFDGVAEGLAWPALAKVVPHAAGATVALEVGRDVPIEVVLRAVWTLRDADVHVQTADADGAVRVIDLAPKQAGAAPAGACHLAVFVAEDGALRIAAPGGPRLVAGAAPRDSLVRALADERTRCPIRYVAYGAEKAGAAWGSVFDVAWAVAREKAAGDARVVLAEPLHSRK